LGGANGVYVDGDGVRWVGGASDEEQAEVESGEWVEPATSV